MAAKTFEATTIRPGYPPVKKPALLKCVQERERESGCVLCAQVSHHIFAAAACKRSLDFSANQLSAASLALSLSLPPPVRPDWALFESSEQQIRSLGGPKRLVTFGLF